MKKSGARAVLYQTIWWDFHLVRGHDLAHNTDRFNVGQVLIGHVKCNGSPVSLTEKGTVFHKTDF